MNTIKKLLRTLAIYSAIVLIAGCNMRDGGRLQPLEPNSFFPNNQVARPLEPHTVVHSSGPVDAVRETGKVGDQLVTSFPFPITRDVLLRGQDRFTIFCTPCHGRTGEGNGMIVQRGFQAPPSFHSDRLRQAPVGHFFDMITNGYGAMYSYADRVDDRWAIVAYIRALQLSEHATLDDVPSAERQQLESAR